MGSRPPSIAAILGDPEPEPIDSASPLAGNVKQERRDAVKKALEEKHARWAAEWLPKGVVLDPFAPQSPWLPPDIDMPRREEG